MEKNISKINSYEKLTIGYFGNFGISNDLNNVLSIFLKINIPFEFHLYGKGTEINKLRLQADNRFFFHDTITRKEALKIMSKMKYLCLATPDKSLYDYGLASLKIVDYLISGAQIIHFSSIKHNFISQNSLGYGIFSEDGIEKKSF